MKLLDTTFLIHHWGGVGAVGDYLAANDESEFATTPLSIEEIAVGRELQGELDLREIRSTFDRVTILPFTVERAFVAESSKPHFVGTMRSIKTRSTRSPETSSSPASRRSETQPS